MIDVGTRLGGKYFIVQKQDRISTGARFEVRNPQGDVRWAQWLHDGALSAAQVSQLQAELSALPSHDAVRAPDELVTSPGGIPAAIFWKPPPPLLTTRTAQLAVGGVEERRLAAIRAIVRWFTTLAETLNGLHATRVVHGALSLAQLGIEGDGDDAKLVMLGFGIEPARRLASGGVKPTPRSDLAAIVLAIQALFEQLGARFAGAALVRWDVLRNCARAGDHDALDSGNSLSRSLRDLLIDEEATHRAKTATPKSAPTQAPPGIAPTAEAPRRRPKALFIGLGVAIVGAASVALLRGHGASSLVRGATSQTSLASARCGDEPMRPALGFALNTAPAMVLAECHEGTLTVVARSVDGVFAAQRPTQRGEGFQGTPTRVSESGAEVSTLDDAGAPWIAWRNAVGAPFGVAQVGPSAMPRVLSLGALRAEQFRGAWLLQVDQEAVWIASNLLSPNAMRAVVLRAPTRPDASPELFDLGEGEVLTAIGGRPSTLLVRVERAVYALTVATNALAVLAGSSSDAATNGAMELRAVPAAALPRSEAWRAPGAWTFAAPGGLAVPGGARHFVATSGDAPLPEGCAGDSCGYRGEVFALSFSLRGPPVATRVARGGRGRGVVVDGDGTRWISGVGARDDEVLLWSIRATGETATHILDARGGPAALSSCGDERWVARSEGGASPRVIASPLPCALLAGR